MFNFWENNEILMTQSSYVNKNLLLPSMLFQFITLSYFSGRKTCA